MEIKGNVVFDPNGACEAGTRAFCEKQKLKKHYLVREIIELTKGAYGNNEYREFFTA